MVWTDRMGATFPKLLLKYDKEETPLLFDKYLSDFILDKVDGTDDFPKIPVYNFKHKIYTKN